MAVGRMLRVSGPLLIAMLLLIPTSGARAACHKHSPSEGATVGPRPTLTFLVDDFKGTMRFSIELSRDKFEKDIRRWDGRKATRMWSTYSEEDGEGGQFHAPEDLAEGTWWWRVTLHDGAVDSGPDFAGSFIVDATPPAEVENLMVTYDAQTGTANLQWDPVTEDLNGGGELVDHYRVYRYERRGIFPSGNLKLLGTTERESFDDPKAGKLTPIAYYRVTAVDSVGNETLAKPAGPTIKPAGEDTKQKRRPPKQDKRRQPGAPTPAPGSD